MLGASCGGNFNSDRSLRLAVRKQTLLRTAAEAVSAPVSAVDGTTETKKIH